MGDKMESDDSRGLDMPTKVLNEILIYLPVKSLIRFTCVCKSWLRLIRTDHQFAMRHYRVKTTSSTSRLMDNVDYIGEHCNIRRGSIRYLSNQRAVMYAIHSLTEKKSLRTVKMLEFGPDLQTSVLNFCHGVMCIYLYSNSTRGARILLCNPAIQEVVTLPVSPKITGYGYGFGFDLLSNDYKVVVVQEPSRQVDVYSVRNGCWHTLDAKAIGPLEHVERFTGSPVLNANGRILNWLTLTRKERESGLLSFDMVEEVFREIPLPIQCYYQHHLLPSSQCQACLCYFASGSFEVWILNGSCKAPNGESDDQERMLWSKKVSVTFPGDDKDVIVSPLDIWMNDKELFVSVENNRKSLWEVFHYDLSTHQLSRTGRLGTCLHPEGYTESLVSIKGFIAANHDQDRTPHAEPDGSGGNQEQEDDGDSVCFIREVARRNHDVRWLFDFKLVSLSSIQRS